MKFHWGKQNNGAMKFDIGSYSFTRDGKRQIHLQWIKHNIAALYGVSFGHSLFIGIIRFDSTQSGSERIK